MDKEKIVVDFKNKSGLLKCSTDILKIIREKFSVANPNYKLRKFYKRIYSITPAGAFQVGIWEEIESFLKSWTIPYTLQITDQFKANFNPKLKGITVDDILPVGKFTYYDYQLATIQEFIRNGRGIGLLATSAGKSVIIGGLCKTILAKQPKAKILIIVPDIGLLTQLKTSFDTEFFIDSVTTWGNKTLPDMEKNILISNTQILLSDVKKSLNLLRDFDYVIMDEVHKLGDRSNKINKVIHNIVTPHKFGLTGTLPYDLMKSWNILGKIGPVLIHETSYSIRQKGTAAEVKTKVMICRHSTFPDPPLPTEKGPLVKYNKEVDFIKTSKKRNDTIVKLCSKLKGNALVMVDGIEYGEHLESRMKAEIPHKQVYFIQGSVETEIREEIKKKIEENDNVICIAMSRIFSTGVSIKNLMYVIFTYIGKSNIKISQSIGRSMRLHTNKTCAYIFDFSDNLEYSLDHLRTRLKLYKEDKIEFEITIINI